eukprot:9835401-Alexandrium_andersonii.AAC.1
MTSSPKILKRVCLRCSNEGLAVGDPRLRERAVPQGREASGANLAARQPSIALRFARLSSAVSRPSILARVG